MVKPHPGVGTLHPSGDQVTRDAAVGHDFVANLKDQGPNLKHLMFF